METESHLHISHPLKSCSLETEEVQGVVVKLAMI